MPSWNELLNEFQALPSAQDEWLRSKMTDALARVSKKRSDRNVMFYGSAFLQKPQAPPPLHQITHEDLNGFMSVMFGMDWTKVSRFCFILRAASQTQRKP
jgi:hypothetical protein